MNIDLLFFKVAAAVKHNIRLRPSLALKSVFVGLAVLCHQATQAASGPYLVFTQSVPIKKFVQIIIDTKKWQEYRTVTEEDQIDYLHTSLPFYKNMVINIFKAPSDSGNNLYATNLKKGTRIRLNGELPTGGKVRNVALSKMHKYAFYLADQEVKNRFEIYRTGTKKSKPIKMNATAESFPSMAGFSDPALFNGTGVTYRAKYNGEQKFALYLSMLKEPIPRKISVDLLQPGSDLSGTYVNPNSKGIAYRANAETTSSIELYYYDIKTFTNHKLNLPLASFSSIGGSSFDSKGKYLYYMADHEVDEKFELYRVDLKTFDVKKISSPIPDDRTLGVGFEFDKSGRTLLYTTNANSPTSATYQVCSVDLKTFETRQITSPDLDVLSFSTDAKGAVYYETQEAETTATRIYKHDLKAGEAIPILSPEIPMGRAQSVQMDASGTHMILWQKEIATNYSVYYYQNLKTGKVIRMQDEPYKANNPILTPSQYFTMSRWDF